MVNKVIGNYSRERMELFYANEWSIAWLEFLLASAWNYFTRTNDQQNDWKLFSRVHGIILHERMINSMIGTSPRECEELFYANK